MRLSQNEKCGLVGDFVHEIDCDIFDPSFMGDVDSVNGFLGGVGSSEVFEEGVV